MTNAAAGLLSNYELDHQLRVYAVAAAATPSVAKYHARLTELRIEADRRNFETK